SGRRTGLICIDRDLHRVQIWFTYEAPNLRRVGNWTWGHLAGIRRVWHRSARAGCCTRRSVAKAANEHCSRRGRQEEADFGEEPLVRPLPPPPALAVPTDTSSAASSDEKSTGRSQPRIAFPYQPVWSGATWQPTFPHDLRESGARVSAAAGVCDAQCPR